MANVSQGSLNFMAMAMMWPAVVGVTVTTKLACTLAVDIDLFSGSKSIHCFAQP
jgi:hypothetical protein